MINLFISEVTRTTLKTGEGFELDQHLTELREPDLDTLLLFDDKELETEIKVELPIAKGISQTNAFGDLCIKECKQSCENKRKQHVVESKAAIDPLVIVKRDSDGHSGLGLAGTLRYGHPMLNRVTLQKVSLSLDAKVVYALLNTMPIVDDLDKAFMGQLSNLRRREHHPVTQISAEATLAPPLYQRERSHGAVVTTGNAESNVTSRFGMPQATRSIDQREMSNSSVAKIGTTEPDVTSHSKERTILPKFRSLYDRNRSSSTVAKTDPIVAWRTRAVMAPPEPRYSKGQGLNNSFSGKASHDIFHREEVKTNTDRGGLTVPSSLALQTLVPVERTTRTHFELSPEMFRQYPLVNSYRVLFRNKYYLFEFEEHQLTNFIEDVYDRT